MKFIWRSIFPKIKAKLRSNKVYFLEVNFAETEKQIEEKSEKEFEKALQELIDQGVI